MQPELFQDLPTEPQGRRFHPPLFPSRFLRVRVAYEDLIFGVLSLLLILLAGFCLGVERGKRMAHPSLENSLPVVDLPAASLHGPHDAAPGSTTSLREPLEELKVTPRAVPRPPPEGIQKGESAVSYAIQLASYLDEPSARNEAQRLRRQRFNAQVVKQGKYFELRVSGYRSRTEAVAPLATLRKTYRDGFIKRVSLDGSGKT